MSDANTLIFHQPGKQAVLKLPRASRFAAVTMNGVLILDGITKPRKYIIKPDDMLANPVYPLVVIVIPKDAAWKWAAIDGNQAGLLIAEVLARAAQSPNPAPPVPKIIDPNTGKVAMLQ